MNKISRKKSQDPLQEHLREQKDLWNSNASDFIARIIAFKKGLNGRGDSQTGLPPSNIKEKFPTQIGSYLHELSLNYSALVDGAEHIIREQEEYAENRHKKSSSLEEDDFLIKEASWPLTRWWASYFGIKGKDRPIIRDMLRSSVSLREKLESIENQLTSSDENCIPKAMYIASSFGIGAYKNLLESFDELKEIHGREVSSKEAEEKKEKEKEKKEKEKINSNESSSVENSSEQERIGLILNLSAIEKDLHNMQSVINYLLEQNDISDLIKKDLLSFKKFIEKGSEISIYLDKLKKIGQLSTSENEDVQKIILAYRKLLIMVGQILGSDSLEFSHFAKIIQEKPSVQHPNVEDANAVYDDPIRWVKRKFIQHIVPDFLRSDVDLSMRKKNTIDHINNTIDSLEKLMDVLIANKSVDSIFESLKICSEKLSLLIEDIITLAEYHATMYRNQYRNQKNNKNKTNPLQNIIEREINKLRKTNIGIQEMSSKILIYKPDFITVAT